MSTASKRLSERTIVGWKRRAIPIGKKLTTFLGRCRRRPMVAWPHLSHAFLHCRMLCRILSSLFAGWAFLASWELAAQEIPSGRPVPSEPPVQTAPPVQVAPTLPSIDGPLARYVHSVDHAFAFELAETIEGDKYTLRRYDLISQRWHGVTWRHILWLVVPKELPSTAERDPGLVLFVGGGSWKSDWGQGPPDKLPPPPEIDLLVQLSAAAAAPVALVEQVPFQPILDGRYEDAAIAETFKRYLQGEGDDWPLLLPMVKTAVVAMDVVIAELQARDHISIEHVTLTGASKRGWTTWLTAAVDPRVDAIAPMVIDMLDMPRQLAHQLETWGAFSSEIADYTSLQLPTYLATPRGQQLLDVVDPYRYRSQIDAAKLLIFGTNDRYWPLDACNLYFDDLSGESNHRLYMPNQGHRLTDFRRLIGSIAALHRSQHGGPDLPRLSFAATESAVDGRLEMTADRPLAAASLWTAVSATRDFRDADWVVQPMLHSGGRYTARLDTFGSGYLAYFVEAATDDIPLPAYVSSRVTLQKRQAR